MELADSKEEEDLTAAQKREPRHKKSRDKQSLKEESLQESCSREPDITKDALLGEEALDDIRPRKQQDIDKEDTNDWTNKGIIESKATDQESDNDDEYWDTMTDIDENEVIRNDCTCKSRLYNGLKVKQS